ncbi:MAG: ATP-binding protein, partial [Candidatus Omnitrophica bacterium]|nr:ATP-binding protein [Candidatus Omnitrophota bacterium]
MKNPFAYGKEVSGENFCNRKEEIKELSQDVNNSQNVIIFSQRRFGKTSLIKEVLRRCKAKGVIVVYVDLYSVLTEEDFVHLYARAVSETIFGKVKKRLRDATMFFKRIRPSFSIDQTGQLSWSIDIKKEHILPSLEDVLESINRYIENKKKKGVVCFDEFQQIGQFKTDKLEKMMRSSFQKHKNISYIFMGSKRHLISEMFNSPHRPFYKSGKPFPLEKIG